MAAWKLTKLGHRSALGVLPTDSSLKAFFFLNNKNSGQSWGEKLKAEKARMEMFPQDFLLKICSAV